MPYFALGSAAVIVCCYVWAFAARGYERMGFSLAIWISLLGLLAIAHAREVRLLRKAKAVLEGAFQPTRAEDQLALGRRYATGRGVPKQYVYAYKWFALAADQGYPEAQAALEQIAQKMTHSQLNDARARMREFWQFRTDSGPESQEQQEEAPG